ncbi:MAG TPA: hypothetical protein PKA74_00825, partial [Bauldia sp.]|nr:hypothetical protein [Bauldia sp.]
MDALSALDARGDFLGVGVAAACSPPVARRLAQATGSIRAIAWRNGGLVGVAAVPVPSAASSSLRDGREG